MWTNYLRLSAPISILSLATAASAGTFTQITNFGGNPGNNRMYLYVPTNVAAKPPILVAIGEKKTVIWRIITSS